MGTPMPENEPGANCPLCFGVGKPLGLVTPRYIWVAFSGVQPGPGADIIQGVLPNGKNMLTQYTNCGFDVHYPLAIVTLLWSASSTLIRWRDASNAILFNTVFPSGICRTSIENSVQWSPTIAAYGGSALVTWSEDGL